MDQHIDRNEQVKTKNFTFSNWTLLPYDKREQKLYYKYKSNEIGDLYLLYLFLMSFGPVQDALEFNKERTTFTFLALAFSICMITMRVIIYLMRHRYPRVFNWHLQIGYLIGQLRYGVVAFIKLRYTPEEQKEEM